MGWFRRYFFRRIVKGFEHRMESLQKLMEHCQAERASIFQKIEMLEIETPLPDKTIARLRDEAETLSRMYWDAFNRHEEVESGLMWVTKDFDRR